MSLLMKEVDATLAAQASRIQELEAALRPFARFWDAQQHMGGTTPKTGPVWSVSSHIGGQRELTVEDFKTAHALLPPSEK